MLGSGLVLSNLNKPNEAITAYNKESALNRLKKSNF
jgi:hypothetical protein